MKRIYLMFALLLLCSTIINAQQGVGYKDGWGRPNGTVNAVAQVGNTIYLGGSFTQIGYPTPYGASISIGSGLPDTVVAAINGLVRATMPDGQGGWYIGGDFTTVGGVARNSAARIYANGGLAPWDPNVGGSVNALGVSGDKVYMGGDFFSVGGTSRSRLAAVDTGGTGSLKAWNPIANSTVYALAIKGGKVYIGGSFFNIGTTARSCLAAVDTAGNLKPWSGNANNTVLALAVSEDKVYIGGMFTSIKGGTVRNRLAAIDTIGTGNLKAWNPNANGQVGALAASGSNVYIGGDFTIVGGQTRNRLAAVDTASAGSLKSWDPNANAYVGALAVSGDNVYIGGNFTTIGGTSRNYLAAVDIAGSGSVQSWKSDADGQVWALAMSGSKIYAGGSFTFTGGTTRNRLAAFDVVTGELKAWNPSANSTVNAMTIGGNTVYIGGGFTNMGSSTRNYLAAVDTGGIGSLKSWNPNANNIVRALAMSRDKVYIGGNFVSIGGQIRNRLAAVDTAGVGSLKAWNPNSNSNVYALAVGGDRVYIGGIFTTIGGQGRNRIASVDTAGAGILKAWNPNANSDVTALAVGGNNVYTGGNFTTVGGVTRNRLAAVDTGGVGSLKDWNPDANGMVQALAVKGDKVYLGGAFTALGVNSRNRLAAVDTVGTGSVKSWNPNANNIVNALAVNTDKVYAGGAFSAMAGYAARPYMMAMVDSGAICTITPGNASVASTAVCKGSTTVLSIASASGATVYQWQSSANENTWVDVANATAATYNAAISGNIYYRCKEACPNELFDYSTPVLVTAIPLDTATIIFTVPDTICYLAPATFTASGTHLGTAPAYAWYRNGAAVPGATMASYTTADISKDASETMSVTVSNINVCVTNTTLAAAPRTVMALPAAPPAVSSSVSGVCPGKADGAIDITATGHGEVFSYSWAGPSEFATTTEDVTNLAAGNYTVTVREGCGGSITNIQVGNTTPVAPTVSVNAPTSICYMQEAAFTATGTLHGTTPVYTWYRNGIEVPDTTVATYLTSNISKYADETISVTVSNINACVTDTFASSAPVTIRALNTLDPNTTYTTASGSTKLCSGDEVTFKSKSNTALDAVFSWARDGVTIPGATTGMYTTSQAGAITATVTNGLGCTRSAAPRIITIMPTAVITEAAGPVLSFCTGSSVTLNATSNVLTASYRWKLGTANKGIVDTQLVKIGGDYTVTVTNSGCATISAPVTVTEKTTDAAVSVIGATIFCTPDYVTLETVNNSAYIYQWYKGTAPLPFETGNSLSTIESGSYRVAVQNGICPIKKSVITVVNATTTPAPAITRTAMLPAYWKLTAAPGGAGYTYQWYKNNVLMADSIKRDLYANKDGNYKVKVTKNGCFETSLGYFVLSNTFKNSITMAEPSSLVNIFPNPSIGVLNIGSEQPVNVVVKDVQGRVVMDARNVSSIDLTNEAAGMYILSISDAEGRLLQVERVVKQ
jgi:hypothetical protein